MPASSLFFHLGQMDDACALVMKWHYSHRIPANVQVVGTFHDSGGLFGQHGPAVAACFFSVPPTRWSEDVLELSRLVRADDLRTNLTALISLTCSAIRRQKISDLLVSFADPGEGHHGGIYQAATWNYAGQRQSAMDGLIINGHFVPGRSCNSIYGTRSPERMRKQMKQADVQPHFDMGKQLYWRALSQSGEAKAIRLGLEKKIYPKPKAA